MWILLHPQVCNLAHLKCMEGQPQALGFDFQLSSHFSGFARKWPRAADICARLQDRDFWHRRLGTRVTIEPMVSSIKEKKQFPLCLWEKNPLTLVQEFSRIPVAIQLLVALANKPLCFRSSTNTPSPSPWQEGKRKILCEAPSVRETFSFFVLFGVCEESQKEKKERHDTLELFVGVLGNP